MGRKLTLSAILTLILVAMSIAYIALEPTRQAAAAKRQQDEAVQAGTKLYASLCMSCHGPKGGGVVGPPLNRPEFREGGPDELKGSGALIREAIRAGRPGTSVPSFLRGEDASWISRTAMPAWGQDKGGPLTAQQIDDLVAFIQHGDWDSAMGAAPPPRLTGQFPSNSALSAAEQEKAQGLLKTKGCLSCHTVGNVGGVIGPDLTYLAKRRDAGYISAWLKGADKVDRSNYVWSADQKIPMGPATMPTIPLNGDELKTIVDFLSGRPSGAAEEAKPGGAPTSANEARPTATPTPQARPTSTPTPVPASNPPAGSASSGDAAKGKAVYAASCALCHGQNAEGLIGPDLRKIGSTRDRDFLTRWMNDPTAVKPGTGMPKPGLGEPDLKAVVDYLLTLK